MELHNTVAEECEGKGGGVGRVLLKPDRRPEDTHTSSHTMAHHTQHMREATHANTTTFYPFFFCLHFVFYKVTI